jgi:hypothetical protein
VPSLIFWLVGNELNKDASTIAIRKTALLLILYLFFTKKSCGQKDVCLSNNVLCLRKKINASSNKQLIVFSCERETKAEEEEQNAMVTELH